MPQRISKLDNLNTDEKKLREERSSQIKINYKYRNYYFSDNRGAIPAITTMLETVRTAKENQDVTLVTDGNPSYQAGLHFINAQQDKLTLTLKKVIGL